MAPFKSYICREECIVFDKTESRGDTTSPREIIIEFPQGHSTTFHSQKAEKT